VKSGFIKRDELFYLIGKASEEALSRRYIVSMMTAVLCSQFEKEKNSCSMELTTFPLLLENDKNNYLKVLYK
jgi:hypothetical protein